MGETLFGYDFKCTYTFHVILLIFHYILCSIIIITTHFGSENQTQSNGLHVELPIALCLSALFSKGKVQWGVSYVVYPRLIPVYSHVCVLKVSLARSQGQARRIITPAGLLLLRAVDLRLMNHSAEL